MSAQTQLEQLSPALAHPVDVDSLPADTPDGVHRAFVRTISGMQKEAVVARDDTAWRLSSDEGDYLDGDDVAPCPLGNMTTGMVAAYLDSIVAAAEDHGFQLDDIELTLDNYYTMKGSALRGDMTGGALDPELRIDIDVPADERDAVSTRIEEAIDAATITNVMETELENPFTLTLGGEELSTDRVPQLDEQPLPDPNSAFGDLERPNDGQDIITRTGEATEDFPEDRERYTAGSGSSLEAEQDRVLHLRGRGSIRDDGTYHITQKLYSPKGTIFEFIADRHPTVGGEGRAPTASTYMAAGIGFCFLTQFGRYAEIKRKTLDAYRIVQDVPWSGDPRSPDAAPEPLETHVYLESPEGEAFARDVLDVSEQTCFLHALCRTSVSPDVTVNTGA